MECDGVWHYHWFAVRKTKWFDKDLNRSFAAMAVNVIASGLYRQQLQTTGGDNALI